MFYLMLVAWSDLRGQMADAVEKLHLIMVYPYMHLMPSWFTFAIVFALVCILYDAIESGLFAW